MRIHSLGYVGVESPAASEWLALGPDVYGLEVEEKSDSAGESVLRVSWDDRAYRLAVHPGPDHKLAYIGWELHSATDLDGAVAELRAHGVEVTEAKPEERADRSVRYLFHFKDPFGNRHELFSGQLTFEGRFRGGHYQSQFVTGSQGLGHAVLVVPDIEQAVEFFTRVLGLKTSDITRVGGPFSEMWFLRAANPRHHSLGLMGMAGMSGLQHVMIETKNMDAVGMAYDAAHKAGLPISSSMGRHIGDRMLSFYARTPTGFDFEIGWDSIQVDDGSWSAQYFDSAEGWVGEVWGHEYSHLGMNPTVHPVDPQHS
ncbi:glyoxalase [Nocardioides eburneiflavus]|uniref:Glyoxalase n=1 Tax=Nocardioides eburneiflavus TaxID=2518372 RepID=A0A4Z1C6T6_9ACTN|nr:VOC family protein [Nocardioides eburneiflavus]TGN65102.1 glyoxalase [Nocardioides eburneiflavus]